VILIVYSNHSLANETESTTPFGDTSGIGTHISFGPPPSTTTGTQNTRLSEENVVADQTGEGSATKEEV
jgi:hypothetical protein